MSNVEAAKKLYTICMNMDIDETMQLVLSAENPDEQEFFSLLSDFVLQKQQKKSLHRRSFR